MLVFSRGAVLAVVLVFAKRVQQFMTEFHKPDVRDYLFKLGAAFGVTAVGGFMIKALDWELPESPVPVLVATVVGGIAILVIEKWLKDKPTATEITWTVAIVAGMAQLLAGSCPGTSRSGATILSVMVLGVARPAATEFSFLLGIPTLVGAGLYEAVSALNDGGPMVTPWGMIALGTIVSAVTAFLAVKWLLHFVQGHTFIGFGWYRIGLGVVIALLLFT